ncbi:MAG: beta-ketoacyl-[acyl-carrier-protein] synthase family protein [Deltaproteobacteria bacterium]|nr:beta-ketoacyl-[acyl-carrier-protein] synthase family protein [Deltaproteobacteria bacterium]
MPRRVVVTGMGLITPLGTGVNEFWGKLIAGRDAVQEITTFDSTPYASHTAAEVSGVSFKGGDRWLYFLDTAFKGALIDSGLFARPRALEGAGIHVGTVLGGILAGQQAWAGCGAKPSSYHLYSGAGHLAEKYGLKGDTLTVSTACASGTDALGIAYRRILWGKADIIIAGGADTLSEFAFSGFNALRALTKTKARPFDKNRDGLVLGEGACFLVLEEQGFAERRGAQCYGLVSGYASRSDARHLTAPDREGAGLAWAIQAALASSGLKRPGYINAHGTGTPYNDVMETKAIKSAFGQGAYEIPISSVKAMIGHSFGAGGAIEAAVCLLALKHGCLPPTINYQEKDQDCDLDYVPLKARETAIDSAMSLSAGFGGQNAALTFEKA